MNTDGDQVVVQVLMFLGELYDLTADFCRQLREESTNKEEATKTPTSDVVCRAYKTGVLIKVWIEFMLAKEDSLVWELDVSQHDSGWLADARISRVGRDGTNTVLQLADKVLPTFADVQYHVPSMLKELFNAGKRLLREEHKP